MRKLENVPTKMRNRKMVGTSRYKHPQKRTYQNGKPRNGRYAAPITDPFALRCWDMNQTKHNKRRSFKLNIKKESLAELKTNY